MCGIAGYIGPRTIDPRTIDRCLELMRRRGPDAAGAFTDHHPGGRRVHLLHTRLAIIDLDRRADQPFEADGRVMVYNGELYNYRELKSDLQRLGHVFRTSSDTEVFLKALTEYGPAGLERCDGMWAAAVYDRETGDLLLCRDRFGEKPLYLHQADQGLYFGSEIKFIAALAQKRLEINHRHLRRYLANGYRFLYKTEDTFFHGVQEMKPARIVTVGPEGPAESRVFWRPRYDPQEDMTFDQAAQGVRSRIIRAVETRLRSDVPLAFCMSGGVDSNSLIAAAKRALGCDVHGFTVQDPDRRYAEADQVRLVVDRLGLRHTSVPTDTAGFLPGLRALIQYHDAPLYTVTYYAHARLMDSIAAHGYKIAVSGAGADEIFSGYYDHHLYYLAEIQNRPQYFPQAVDNWERLVKPDIRNPVLRDLEAFLINPDPGRYIDDETDAVRPFLTPDQSESFHQRDYFPGALRNRMANEIFEEVIPPILHEDDLNAMRRSIENRSPFLDPDLYEFSLTIPTRHLIRNGYAKAVLRQAMRGLVPDPILDRREKIGFNAPIMSYLDPADPEVRSFIASDSPVFDWVRRDRLLELIDRPRPPNWASKFLFNFLCAKMFLELF